MVPPDLGEQPLAADDLAAVLEQVVQEVKLAVGQGGDVPVDRSLPSSEVERQPAGPQNVSELALAVSLLASQVHAHARDQLVERERFRQVVASAELEAAELRLKVASRREDQHG